ncbi:hypothetical protein Dimus_015293 [Dionaea muscipula]
MVAASIIVNLSNVAVAVILIFGFAEAHCEFVSELVRWRRLSFKGLAFQRIRSSRDYASSPFRGLGMDQYFLMPSYLVFFIVLLWILPSSGD